MTTAGLAVAALLAVAAPAARRSRPDRLPGDDAGGFRNILPPGQGQNVNAAEIAAFLGGEHATPRTTTTSSQMYADLVYAAPGLGEAQIDHTSRTPASASGRARSSAPTRRTASCPARRRRLRAVVIQRHATASRTSTARPAPGRCSAPATPAAEDRLFFMDALRHAGRGQLSSFAGGSNAAMDREVWADTPTPRPSCSSSTTSATTSTAPTAPSSRPTSTTTSTAINQYIAEIKRSRSADMPGEYAALGQPLGPEPVEGHRRDRDRLAGRRASSARAAAARSARRSCSRRPRSGSEEAGQARLGRLPQRRTTPRRRRRCTRPAFPYASGPKKPKKTQRPGAAGPRHDPVPSTRSSRPAAVAAPTPAARQNSIAGAARRLRHPGLGLERAARLGRRVGARPPARGDRAPGRLLQPRDPDGAGHPRPGDQRRPRRSTRAAPPSRAPTSTSSSATAATTRGARPRPARTSSTPSRSRSATPTGRRPRSTRSSYVLPRPVPAVRGARARRTAGRRRSPTRPRRARETLRVAAHEARDRHPHARRSTASPTPTRSCATPTSTRSTPRSASPTSTTPTR